VVSGGCKEIRTMLVGQENDDVWTFMCLRREAWKSQRGGAL
jgi:hypothetical protein